MSLQFMKFLNGIKNLLTRASIHSKDPQVKIQRTEESREVVPYLSYEAVGAI